MSKDNILYNKDKMKKIFIENIQKTKKILVEEKSKEIEKMKNTTNQAFSEVYDILIHLHPILLSKIPQNFIDNLEKHRDLRL